MAKKPKTNVNINGYDYAKTTLTVGKDFEGKPIRQQFYGKTKTDADNKKEDFKDQFEKGVNPKLGKQSLSQAAYTWLWNVEYTSKNKSSTFERYEGIYRNYIQDSNVGKMLIPDITTLALQIHFNKLKKEDYTYSQMHNLMKVLKKFFNYAEDEGYVLKSPCKGVKIPKDDEEELDDTFDEDDFEEKYDAFTEEEIKKIFSYLTPDKKLRYVALTAFFTGAREGEILALDEKKDIKDNKFKIYKTVKSVKVFDSPTEHHYEFKVTRPKTPKSKRIAPINKVLAEELKQLKKLNAIEKLRVGPSYIDKGLLFPAENGNYIDASNLLKQWKKALAAAGVEYKKFHALRDTYASMLAKRGTSLTALSRLLGHSATKQTEKYIHVDESTRFEEVEKLNDVL